MELKRIEAINLPTETKKEVKDKIIALKRLEKELNDAYASVIQQYKHIQAEKKEFEQKIANSLKETTNKALSFDNFDGVIIKKTTSYVYDNEKLLSLPSADKFTKRTIDKTAFKNWFKYENGSKPIDGYKVEMKEIKQLDLSKIIMIEDE